MNRKKIKKRRENKGYSKLMLFFLLLSDHENSNCNVVINNNLELLAVIQFFKE